MCCRRPRGDPSALKIAYLYYDNAAGHDPLIVIEEMARREDFELRTFAVPPPGLEMSAQVADIVSRFQPDWVITHLFGRAPSVSIATLKRAATARQGRLSRLGCGRTRD